VTNVYRIAILALLMVAHSAAAEVRMKGYGMGLPDYEKNPVFKTDAAAPHLALRAALPKTAGPLCVRGKVEGTVAGDLQLKTNVCDDAAHAKIKEQLRRIAPSLDAAKLSFRATDLDSDGEPELLVEYIDLPPPVAQKVERGPDGKPRLSQEVVPIPGAAPDPYLSLWLLKFDGKVYRATYAGPFLVGQVHGEAPFGQSGKNAMVFVRHDSCTECHFTTYLTVVDFFRHAFFEFSYDDAHKEFGSTIEYALAGHGHTVDAEVETRVLPASPKGPHLMQQFRLDDGKVEWWIFRCVEVKCDYEMHLGALPERYRKDWERGRKL
jgi:hypothetical protein